MNCSPNCLARFSDWKQIRFKHNASHVTVPVAPTAEYFAAFLSYAKYG